MPISGVKATDAPARLDRVIAALVQAWRCLKLYPRENPVVAAALEKLDSALAALSGTEGKDAEILRACEVRPDGFYAGDVLLCANRADVPRFALQLYREGAKLLRFDATATGRDALGFLEGCIAAELAKGEKPLRDQLQSAAVSLEFFEEAEFTQRETPAQELQEQDVLSYFLAQRQGEHPAEKPGAHMRDFLHFLMAAERGSEVEKQVLLNTLAEPDKIAQTFSYVAHGEKREGISDQLRADHALRQTLCHIELFVKDIPKHLRERILENMSEASLITDEETRERLLNAVLPSALGDGGIEAELAAFLPPRVASSVVLRYVQVHDGTSSAVQSFVQNVPEIRQRRLMETLFENLDALPSFALPEATQEAFRALIPQPRPAPLPGTIAPSPAAAQDRLKELSALAETAMKISPEESIQIRRQVAAANETRDNQQDALTFFYLFALGDLQPEERMLQFLQSTLQKAMEDREFDFVNHVVQLALGNVRTDVREDSFATLQASLTGLYGQDGMTAFINHLTHVAKTDQAAGDARMALHALADDATPALIKRLEGEETKQRRFDLLNLLLEMGPVVLNFLHQQVRSPQWFVVRNAVYLMGRLPNPENLPALEIALKHPDPRVRDEALKALALTPCTGKAPLLLGLLEDPELSLRSRAAEVLGATKDLAHAAAIAERLQLDTHRMRKNPEYALTLLRAVAEVGGAESIKPLKRFLRLALLPGTQSRPQVRKMARWALMQARSREAAEKARPSDAGRERGA